MKIEKSEIIPEVIKITPSKYNDERGSFTVAYVEGILAEQGATYFVQDNISSSHQNVLRGLHYQIKPYAQGKLVTCISGNIYDVAVDLRPDSPTYLKWVGFYLSGELREQLWIPRGFAHGYYTSGDKATIMYKTTNYYSPEHERTLIWNDPTIGVIWRNTIVYPLLSEKDKKGKLLEDLIDEF